jgi:hypothetical protein
VLSTPLLEKKIHSSIGPQRLIQIEVLFRSKDPYFKVRTLQ